MDPNLMFVALILISVETCRGRLRGHWHAPDRDFGAH
jgi:hypothetical protein